MSLAAETAADGTEARSGLMALGLLSLLVGAVAGLVASVFRLALDHADNLRGALIAWAQGWHFWGLLFSSDCPCVPHRHENSLIASSNNLSSRNRWLT